MLSFSGLRCTPRLMERCVSTRNLSTPKRVSSTTRGSSTTSRWERAAWVDEGDSWIMCVFFVVFFTFECTWLYPFDFVYEWKERPVVKGWQRCQASFTQNEYLIKMLPFNSLSKALVLQSFQTQCKRRWWWWCGGKAAKRSKQLPDCRPFSSLFPLFLFLSLFCVSPPFHPSVFVLSVLSLSLCERYHSAEEEKKNTFHVLSVCCLRLLSLTLLPSSLLPPSNV